MPQVGGDVQGRLAGFVGRAANHAATADPATAIAAAMKASR